MNGPKSLIEKAKKVIESPEMATQYVWGGSKLVKLLTLTASSQLPIGVNVFELDWDLLVVLDSCRADALQTVSKEDSYSFLSPKEVNEMISVGGSTLEWTTATFTEPYRSDLKQTALVSANGWPHRILDEGFKFEKRYGLSFAPTNWETVPGDSLGRHCCAWQYGAGRAGWSEQPQADGSTVADLTIDIGREDEFDRVIAHFIEPHYPYAAAARKRGKKEMSTLEQHPFDYLRSGGDRERVWETYLSELRSGLESVSTLLHNFDAETVLITADHGECFGEWGYYGHSSGSLLPQVRRVPIVTTTATDTHTHQPVPTSPKEELSVEENLRSLGYLN